MLATRRLWLYCPKEELCHEVLRTRFTKINGTAQFKVCEDRRSAWKHDLYLLCRVQGSFSRREQNRFCLSDMRKLANYSSRGII